MQNQNGQQAINTSTGSWSYPHQQQEICYSWNNVVTKTNLALGFGGGQTLTAGRDYVNMGAGLPPDQIPPAVQQFYNAQVNGVAYTKEFDYPHPLRSGGHVPSRSPLSPTPTPTATPRPTPTARPRPPPPRPTP